VNGQHAEDQNQLRKVCLLILSGIDRRSREHPSRDRNQNNARAGAKHDLTWRTLRQPFLNKTKH
jgi:hypothetical protein